MDNALEFTNHVPEVLDAAVTQLNPPTVHLLVDVNTRALVLPLLQSQSKTIASAHIIGIPAGEPSKTLDTLQGVWKQLGDSNATRSSLLINLGGGVVTDLGGLAAATFKRGMKFINIPTTLLGAVDASVGGKTAINFNNLKNEVGVFQDAWLSIISTEYFRTLTSQELLSGYAEMIKHALISSAELTDKTLGYNILAYNDDSLLDLLRQSVEVKLQVVEKDHHDTGARHALNLGHTVGHAFESLALERKSPLPHGYAVAYGMLVSMILSRMKLDFSSDVLQKYTAFMRTNYGAFDFSCNDYPRLLKFMHADKKNATAGEVNFTLLAAPGDVRINQTVADADITAALDIYRDLVGF